MCIFYLPPGLLIHYLQSPLPLPENSPILTFDMESSCRREQVDGAHF